MNYRFKKYSWFVGLIVLVILINISINSNDATFAQKKPVSNISDAIHNDLADLILDGKAPGLIAAIISSDSVIAIASAGVRKAGSDILIRTNDNVHLGSCAKIMTSVMLATLVAEGKLSSESKLIDVIPEIKICFMFKDIFY